MRHGTPLGAANLVIVLYAHFGVAIHLEPRVAPPIWPQDVKGRMSTSGTNGSCWSRGKHNHEDSRQRVCSSPSRPLQLPEGGIISCCPGVEVGSLFSETCGVCSILCRRRQDSEQRTSDRSDWPGQQHELIVEGFSSFWNRCHCRVHCLALLVLRYL